MAYFEKRFTPVMYKAIRGQIKDFIASMRSNGLPQAKRELDRIVINADVYKALERIYKVVGVDTANNKLKEILEQPPKK